MRRGAHKGQNNCRQRCPIGYRDGPDDGSGRTTLWDATLAMIRQHLLQPRSAAYAPMAVGQAAFVWAKAFLDCGKPMERSARTKDAYNITRGTLPAPNPFVSTNDCAVRCGNEHNLAQRHTIVSADAEPEMETARPLSSRTFTPIFGAVTIASPTSIASAFQPRKRPRSSAC